METSNKEQSVGGGGRKGWREWCRQPLAAHSFVINDHPTGSKSGPGKKTDTELAFLRNIEEEMVTGRHEKL